MSDIQVASIPIHIIHYHRLARMGQANVYSPAMHLVQFKLPDPAHHFSALNDVVSLILIYRRRET